MNVLYTLAVEGDVKWLNPGEVSGLVELPVKTRKTGKMPLAIVAKSGSKEERKIVWTDVSEVGSTVARNRSPKCGVSKEPEAKYCCRCGAKLA